MASLIATGFVGLFSTLAGAGIIWVYKVMENC